MSVKGALNVRLVATISRVWPDNEAEGYLEMTLNIGHETSDPLELRARYETTQEPAADTSYVVSGELFYDPGQRWSSGSRTITYVLIKSLQKVSTDSPREPDVSLFDMMGTVRTSEAGQATISYYVYDEYEMARYAQNVKVYFESELASQVKDGAILAGCGTLHSLDRLLLQQIARPC
ncbi:MAG: hypothetical protein FRX49_00841 [Trebouxia sp. A1-2]|nr:MAG: hypothetical protein FRX49_00841 [Trebouxia sp. A1-2]